MVSDKIYIVCERTEEGTLYPLQGFESEDKARSWQNALEEKWKRKYTVFDTRGPSPWFKDTHGTIIAPAIIDIPLVPEDD